MRNSTFGARGIAAYRWRRAQATLGNDHPATLAALGRVRFYRGEVPQKRSTSIESVAWHRESGAIPGYMNRAERRARAA